MQPAAKIKAACEGYLNHTSEKRMVMSGGTPEMGDHHRNVVKQFDATQR